MSIRHRQARGGQSAELIRTAHPSHLQRESPPAHRVWEAGADRRGGERHRERLSGSGGQPGGHQRLGPALQQHQALFGQAPRLATADRGYFSAENERQAQARGVEKVALPARGRLSRVRAGRQKQRWFQRALRWRAGSEATISTLKHPFSMLRATYKGDTGFQRYVGWSIITKKIARWRLQRKGHAPPR
jgi:IS5 family transposase